MKMTRKNTVKLSKYTFVYVGCGQFRKGIDLLINAWKDAFVKADNVQLFIKDSPAVYGQNTIFHQIMRLQYYEDCGNIIFSSPNSFETNREIDSYNMDFKKKICYFHSYFFPPIEGRIIVFPSHLEHHVDFNKSNEDRISVSFNIRLSD